MLFWLAWWWKDGKCWGAVWRGPRYDDWTGEVKNTEDVLSKRTVFQIKAANLYLQSKSGLKAAVRAERLDEGLHRWPSELQQNRFSCSPQASARRETNCVQQGEMWFFYLCHIQEYVTNVHLLGDKKIKMPPWTDKRSSCKQDGANCFLTFTAACVSNIRRFNLHHNVLSLCGAVCLQLRNVREVFM